MNDLMKTCPTCGGRGECSTVDHDTYQCPTCKGSRYVVQPAPPAPVAKLMLECAKALGWVRL